jgi:hypothetical protein
MLLKVTAYAPRPVREAVVVIARSEAPSPQFIAAWSDVLEWGGTIGDLYSLAASESEKEIAWKTLMIMAGRVSAPFGLLLTEAEWAAKNLTDVLKLTWTSVQVKSLTAMTENDLTALKSSSAQLGSVAKRIGQINKRLAGTSMDCDSTQLVRAPAEAAPPDSADDKKKGPSTAKTVVGVGAAVGGVAAAAYAYEEYKKLQEENGGGSCGPQPSIDFNPSVQSRPSDAQLNALRTWCRCKGYSGIGNGSNGFGCVQ